MNFLLPTLREAYQRYASLNRLRILKNFILTVEPKKSLKHDQLKKLLLESLVQWVANENQRLKI